MQYGQITHSVEEVDVMQTVTYQISIPATDNYTITGGGDDTIKIFLSGSTTALSNFNPATGGIFASGSYTTPYSNTVALNSGTLTMVVQCTNNAGGTGYGDNPVGWYVKIVGVVRAMNRQQHFDESSTTSTVVAFMNTYAAFPSNTDHIRVSTDNINLY